MLVSLMLRDRTHRLIRGIGCRGGSDSGRGPRGGGGFVSRCSQKHNLTPDEHLFTFRDLCSRCVRASSSSSSSSTSSGCARCFLRRPPTSRPKNERTLFARRTGGGVFGVRRKKSDRAELVFFSNAATRRRNSLLSLSLALSRSLALSLALFLRESDKQREREREKRERPKQRERKEKVQQKERELVVVVVKKSKKKRQKRERGFFSSLFFAFFVFFVVVERTNRGRSFKKAKPRNVAVTFYTFLSVYSTWLSVNVLKSSLRRPRFRATERSVPESITTWTRTSPRRIASSKPRKFSRRRRFNSLFVFIQNQTRRVLE